MDLSFIEANAKQWVDAIVRQGYRLLDTANMGLQFEQGKSDQARCNDFRGWIRIEEHFFVIAVGKSMDWLKELRPASSRYHLPIDEFFIKIPDTRDVRNMREHDNEYLRGRGNKQSIFHKKITEYERSGWTISADATATIVIGDDYLIGGRLNVRETIKAAEQLQQSIFTDKK